MKKRFILPLLFVPFFLVGCSNSNSSEVISSSQAENVITFNTNEINIMEGDQFQLSYTCSEKTNALAFWSSRDTSIATVSNNGLVTGVKPGVTNISLMIGKVTAFVVVNVARYSAKEDLSIDLPKNEYTLNVGDEFALPIKARLGKNEVDASYSYVLDNSGVFEVTNNVVTAIKAGEGELLIKASYESYNASLGVKITVLA